MLCNHIRLSARWVAPCARPAQLLALLALTLAALFLTPGRAAAQYTALDDPIAVYGTFACGINDRGQVVGYYLDNIGPGDHGFVLSQGVYTTLDPPTAVYGPFGTFATGINAQGQIVGTYFDNIGSGLHGFVLNQGVFTTLDDPNAVYGTVANGINNQGQIVGAYLDNIGEGAHGFVLSP